MSEIETLLTFYIGINCIGLIIIFIIGYYTFKD